MPASTARQAIADTFTRLLRLNPADGPPRLSREKLMEESEAVLAQAARTGSNRERGVATQLLAHPSDYRRWESEHLRLMAAVAGTPRPGLQVRALLSTSVSLIHRKALFEYLRDHGPRGGQRRLLIHHFHGFNSYTQAVVAEHSNYLRSFASLICAEGIGATLLAHQAFGEPLRAYEQLYAEYFRNYCHSVLAPTASADDDTVSALLPYLKQDVLDVRTRLLAMPAVAERSGKRRTASTAGAASGDGAKPAGAGSRRNGAQAR